VYKIAEISELNASKILKLSYDLVDKASLTEGQDIIDETFVEKLLETNMMESKTKKSITTKETTDLVTEAKGD
jgi:hypothetical protein